MRNKKEASGLLFCFFIHITRLRTLREVKERQISTGGVLFDMDFIKWRKNKQRINIFENL